MRSSACDTRSRSCARRVLCWLAFPLASALGSTDSAASCPALFVGFPATIAESDFPRPFIIGYGSSPSRCGPERRTAAGQTWDLPVPVQGASAHARFFDHAGPFGPCDGASETCCLPRSKRRQHPGIGFRGSMAGLCPPLPTLRRRPRGRQRTARGRCGSLLLHRSGLAPPTPCRSPGALRVLSAQPRSRSPRGQKYADPKPDGRVACALNHLTINLAPCSTAAPIRRHQVLNRVLALAPSRFVSTGLPSKIV